MLDWRLGTCGGNRFEVSVGHCLKVIIRDSLADEFFDWPDTGFGRLIRDFDGLLVGRGRRNHAFISDLGQLLYRVLDPYGPLFDALSRGPAGGFGGCGLRGPRIFRPLRPYIRARGRGLRLFRGLAEVDLLFILHELGEIGDIQECVAVEPYINKGGLHAGQHFHHAALVEIAHHPLILVSPLDIKLGNYAVFENRYFLLVYVRTNNQFFRHELSW